LRTRLKSDVFVGRIQNVLTLKVVTLKANARLSLGPYNLEKRFSLRGFWTSFCIANDLGCWIEAGARISVEECGKN
jgi:hypothetical protein